MSAFLSVEEMRFLRRHFSPRVIELGKNEIVYRQNLEEDAVLLLLDGLVYIRTENEQFSRSILRFCRPGELFERSALLPARYGVSYLLAKSSGRIAVFSKTQLLRFFLTSPQWQQHLELLSGEKTYAYPFLLHQRSIRARLMHFFREETAVQHGQTIRLPIPYTDLADYLAVERTAMMKELKKMKDEGLISAKQRTLTML
jgi:CRP-like cAMP-binding protein